MEGRNVIEMDVECLLWARRKVNRANDFEERRPADDKSSNAKLRVLASVQELRMGSRYVQKIENFRVENGGEGNCLDCLATKKRN